MGSQTEKSATYDNTFARSQLQSISTEVKEKLVHLFLVHVFGELLDAEVAAAPAADHKVRARRRSLHRDLVVEHVDAIFIGVESEVNRSSRTARIRRL